MKSRHNIVEYIRNGKIIPNRLLTDILLQASDNGLQLYASEEFSDLFNSLKKSRPYFMYIHDLNDPDISYYLKVYEPMFKTYAEQVRMKQITAHKNEYHDAWNNDRWVYETQVKIMLRMWGNRDAMTGDEFPKDSYGRVILAYIVRHHYKISLRDNKLECWVEVQVPLTPTSHGQVHNTEFEDFFTRAVQAMINGDLQTLISILREKWDLTYVREYENWLKQNRFI